MWPLTPVLLSILCVFLAMQDEASSNFILSLVFVNLASVVLQVLFL